MKFVHHDHSPQVIAAATQAARRAAAAAEAALQAVQALVKPAPTEPVGVPFAEITLPLSDPPAKRRKKPIIYLRRVHFHCPACRRLTVLSVAHCGRLVSCPKCFTGIRVPDPRRPTPAVNLGRTMEPMLHPERFARCVDARRLLPWIVGRLPSAAQTLVAIGILLLLGGTTAIAPVSLSWASHPVSISSLARSGSSSSVAPVRHYAEEAEQAVRQFLAAPDALSKSQWVTDPARTLPLMMQWYEARSAKRDPSAVSIGLPSQGFYATPGASVTVSEVPVEFPGSPVQTYLVEHLPEGPRIAWAESVGYSPVAWEELVKQPHRQEPVRLRLLACLDDYYNFYYTSEDEFCCIRLHDPETLQQLGFGYLPRQPGLAESLALALPGPDSGNLQSVTVSVKPEAHSARTRQVRVVGTVQPGWKAAVSDSRGVIASSPRPAVRFVDGKLPGW